MQFKIIIITSHSFWGSESGSGLGRVRLQISYEFVMKLLRTEVIWRLNWNWRDGFQSSHTVVRKRRISLHWVSSQHGGQWPPSWENQTRKRKRAVSSQPWLRSDRPSRAQYSLSVIHTNPEAVREEGTWWPLPGGGACGRRGGCLSHTQGGRTGGTTVWK